MRRTLVTVLSILCALSIYCQSLNRSSEYRKIHLSINAGWDFVQGTSNTTFSDDFTLPLTKKGFTPGIDAAYFFTRNYGVGIKYRFYKASRESSSYSEYTDSEGTAYEIQASSFKDKTHMVGPAFFARWSLGDSKWIVSTNAGAVYVHNELSEIFRVVARLYKLEEWTPDLSEANSTQITGYGDLSGNTIGLTLSAGIRYQIFPFLGAGISANGLFASMSKMEQVDISRKINRIGVSAAIDFSF